MTLALGWAAALLIFIIVITVSIALHELGHLSVAKALKIPVPEYFVGFGPTLWSRKRGSTTYGVKALPLGGFIKVEDTTQPEGSPERGLLSYVAPWKRFLIFLAGPAVNIVLGCVIIFGLMVTTPVTTPTTTVDGVATCSTQPTACAASQAGFLPGDRVKAIAGHPVTSPDDFQGKFSKQEVPVVVDRGGKEVTLRVKGNEQGRIGITLRSTESARTAGEAASLVGNILYANAEALASLPSKVENLALAVVGQEPRSENTVTSIIGVGRTYGETYTDTTHEGEEKVQMLIFYSGLLNLGLGFANLLPLMPLDGGRMVFAVIDSLRQVGSKIARRRYTPTDIQWINATTAVTAAFLFTFMALAMVADVVAPVGS